MTQKEFVIALDRLDVEGDLKDKEAVFVYLLKNVLKNQGKMD